ncbi:MAG TPA: BadF/BadG/BcrA/BcrD ATPase family protein [Candidatus Cybelea sp.]|nr:BadF/BadG/BcrA/BcrD ATPase family protein [Candidatus Cybelea sp.]
MRLVAGIDGGQSSTVAVIGDETGRILGRGFAGPADEVGAGRESARLSDALHGALDGALKDARLSGASFDAIVAGISGYDGRVYGRMPALPSTRTLLMHDTPIAHAGAFGGDAGVIVIAGTGSVVYGTNENGWSCTLGGWGYLFGDEGSAFAIVRDALARCMRAHDDGDLSFENETRSICEFFEVPSLRPLVHAFYKGEVTRDRLASFAPRALEFESVRSIAQQGAGRLAQLVGRAIAAGAAPRVAFTGGLFADDRFEASLRAAILHIVPNAAIAKVRYEPADGALLLAYRALGIGITELAR